MCHEEANIYYDGDNDDKKPVKIKSIKKLINKAKRIQLHNKDLKERNL